ncbi:MAG: DUF169 domain-containing protein [Oscillospiraceae bacterium]|nr:DUF169 domain-containing protein [Oscillospiraceae bacterium]
MLESNKERQALMDRLAGLRYPAVALRMVREGEPIPEGAVRPYRDTGKHIALCQAFAFARRQGKVLYLEKEDHWCWNPIITYGMIDKELGKEGFRAIAREYGGSSASGEAFVDSFPCLPVGKYRGILVAPLTKADFQPDVTLIYCKNDQLRLFLMAVDTQTHAMLESSFSPVDSCTYSVIPAILEGKYRITIPDPGEYERGLTPEDDIIFSVPRQREEEFYRGVAAQGAHGDRSTFYMTMKEDFARPHMYDILFETWGLMTGEEWDKK